MPISLIINGVKGKMGSLVEQALPTQSGFKLVTGTDRKDDLAKIIKATGAEVVIDFTTPQTVFQNAETIIQSGARPVIGTTGLTREQIAVLEQQCRDKKLGGIIAPNFSMGAVLMMQFATQAAQYFPDVEIIEMHHPQKVDAPSGTAIKTAQMIAETSSFSHEAGAHKDRARGEIKHGVTIHSVRLPGLFSQQSVIFGGEGELLTLRHDGMDRRCTLPGIFLACRKVMELDHLVYGLESILDQGL